MEMKKTLLALVLGLGVVTAATAQVITYVEEPPGLMGGYDFTWVGPDDGWGSPDLSIPGTSVTDTLAFVSDGTVGIRSAAMRW